MTMKPIKAPTVGTMLLYGAAAFQATQFARAFHALDATSGWAQAGGILAGVVVNVGLAYSASRLPRIKAKKAQRLAYIAFGILVLMTPVFLAPINYVTMGDLWASAPILRWTLAIIGASLVDVAISLVAFADGSLITLGATLSDAQRQSSDDGSDTQRNSTTLKGRSAKKSATLYRCECGETFADRFKYSGHTRICSTHKTAKEKVIPVELPSKVEPQP